MVCSKPASRDDMAYRWACGFKFRNLYVAGVGHPNSSNISQFRVKASASGARIMLIDEDACESAFGPHCSTEHLDLLLAQRPSAKLEGKEKRAQRQ